MARAWRTISPTRGGKGRAFYGFYTSCVRADRRDEDASEAEPKRATLVADLGAAHQHGLTGGPARLKACGGPLKIVAYVSDKVSIRRIPDHLGLSPPEQEKPPPIPEVIRVPVDEQGREKSRFSTPGFADLP
jgi:hypothetical protein